MRFQGTLTSLSTTHSIDEYHPVNGHQYTVSLVGTFVSES